MNYSDIYNHIENKNIHAYTSNLPSKFQNLIPHSHPLSSIQMEKIKGFLDYFVFSQEVASISTNGTKLYRHLVSDNLITCLYKSYGTDHSLLKKARIAIFGNLKSPLDLKKASEEFDLLLCFIRNPAILADQLKIDHENKTQVYAAKIFIKSFFKSNISKLSISDLTNVISLYKKKLFISDKKIIPKHLLLIENTPVKCLSNPKTILDVILSNTHFFIGTEEMKPDHPSKKKLGQLFSDGLVKSEQNPHLAPLLKALATLFTVQKGHILFSDSNHSIDSFFPNQSLYGKYNNKHTIYCRSIFKESFRGFHPGALSTFFHEVLHCLINWAFENDSDPTPLDNNQQQKEFNEILQLDQKDQEAFFLNEMTNKQFKMLVEYFKNLINNEHYFPEGFRPLNDSDLATMRVEAIVKPVQFIVSHEATNEDLNFLFPRNWKYYTDVVLTKINDLAEINMKRYHLFDYSKKRSSDFEESFKKHVK